MAGIDVFNDVKMDDSKFEVLMTNITSKRDILKSWEGIMKRLEDAMPQNLYKHGLEKHFPNIAMINEIDVVDKETGKKETVRPRQLAELTKYLIGQMVGDPQLQMFSKYFDKLINSFNSSFSLLNSL